MTLSQVQRGLAPERLLSLAVSPVRSN